MNPAFIQDPDFAASAPSIEVMILKELDFGIIERSLEQARA